jgi:hypothetical protein
MSLSSKDLETLKAAFPANRLGVKIQSFSRDRKRAMLVCYLQHTDVMDRLDQVDPTWKSEITREERVGDTVYVSLMLTLKGVSRENVGEGGDPKAAYSDALKRAAMLFGVGRYLYDSETVWVDYVEERDRFRQWSYDDYKNCLQSNQKGVPVGEMEETAEPHQPGWSAEQKVQIIPRAKPENRVKKRRESPTPDQSARERINARLMKLYRPYLSQYPDTSFVNLLFNRYKVGETRLMTIEQCQDLVRFLEERLEAEVQ